MKIERIDYDGWTLATDADATRAAYAASGRGAHVCRCAYCRNFVAVRDEAYPRSFVALLSRLGIDPHKEAEVSEFGQTDCGRRLYSGFYHFVGEVIGGPGDRMSVIEAETANAPWQVFFANRRSLAFDSFGDQPLVQLEFTVELPWVLPEAELLP